MINPNTIDDGIKELTEKIIGMRRAQEAMRFLPFLEGVEYWGTDGSVCITLNKAKKNSTRHLIEKEGWILTSRHRGNTIIKKSYSHPQVDKIELVLYVDPNKESE